MHEHNYQIMGTVYDDKIDQKYVYSNGIEVVIRWVNYSDGSPTRIFASCGNGWKELTD